jgi:hypothetical protein
MKSMLVKRCNGRDRDFMDVSSCLMQEAFLKIERALAEALPTGIASNAPATNSAKKSCVLLKIRIATCFLSIS